ncbi:MAG TPA: hypothetical protein VIK42_00720 [Bacteroidales bacterium]
MTDFKRGITDKRFIESLNKLYLDENSFWHKMVSDKELFIAIRNDYINVYFKGQSLCKLTFSRNGVIKGNTHKKYIVNNTTDNTYILSENGVIKADVPYPIMSLSQVNELKYNVKRFVGNEKESSYNLVLSKEEEKIDVEITFSETNNLKRSSIDYSIIKKEKDVVRLVFYEAKYYTNPELVSITRPRVLDQIKRYEVYISSQKDIITESYEQICKNMKSLGLATSDSIVSKIADGILKLEVDELPILIIFGMEEAMKNSKKWKGNLNTLEQELKPGRIIIKTQSKVL